MWYLAINLRPSNTNIHLNYVYIYIYLYCYFILMVSFQELRNLDEIFTYNHMSIIPFEAALDLRHP